MLLDAILGSADEEAEVPGLKFSTITHAQLTCG